VIEARLVDMTSETRSYATDADNGRGDPCHVGAAENTGVRYQALLGGAAGALLGCETDPSTAIGRVIAKCRHQAQQIAAADASKQQRLLLLQQQNIMGHKGGQQQQQQRSVVVTAGAIRVMNEFTSVTDGMRLPRDLRDLADELFARYLTLKNVIAHRRRAAYAACVFFVIQNDKRLHCSDQQIAILFGVGQKFGRTCNEVQAALIRDQQYAHVFHRGIGGQQQQKEEEDQERTWTTAAAVKKDGSAWVSPMVNAIRSLRKMDIGPVMLESRRIWAIVLATTTADDDHDDRRPLQKKNAQGVTAAIVSVACRNLSVPLTDSDIIKYSTASGFTPCKKDFRTTFDALIRINDVVRKNKNINKNTTINNKNNHKMLI
jgi:transcription initiation factor TFIIIB Brf1 subunit/transcription initiation factor TFIIB